MAENKLPQSIQNVSFKKFLITPSGLSEENKAVNCESAIVALDYFEDLLSPSISCRVQILDTANFASNMNLRGYERVDLVVGTAFGDFVFDGDGDRVPFYVNSVEGLVSSESAERFTLECTTKQNLDNEATRCRGIYKKLKISDHVKAILEDTLGLKGEESKRMGTIEDTANSYGFYGNQKKPFHVCTWLGPKAISQRQGVSGESGKGTTAESRGSAGFMFYENYDGFHFRSIDSLVSKTISPLSADEKDIPVYEYTGEQKEGGTSYKIIHYGFDKNVDLFKNMRVGMYSNLTYFFNPYDWEFDAIKYTMTQSVEADLGDFIPIPGDDLPDKQSRVMVRIGDQGMFGGESNLAAGSGRDNTDMAKSFSRYNLMFLQSLNIVVPCNVNLRVGDIIKVVLPSTGPADRGDKKEANTTHSGYYLIRSLRHHFEKAGGNNITALNLIRDCYGLSL